MIRKDYVIKVEYENRESLTREIESNNPYIIGKELEEVIEEANGFLAFRIKQITIVPKLEGK